MADVITSGASVIAPTTILGYESSREQSAIVHPIINRASPDVTLRPARLRSGRMDLGFVGPSAEIDSRVAENILADAALFTLTSADVSTLAMTFFLPKGGTLSRRLEDTTRAAWVVSFDWQEIAT